MYLKLGTLRRREDIIMEENLKSKTFYKLTILYLKIFPIIIAVFDFLDTLLSYLDVDIPVISYIAGISFLSIIFTLLASFTFKFCIYHRLPLYYVILNNIVCIYDTYIGIPINDRAIFSLYLFILFSSVLTALIIHVKANKRITVKNSK